MRGIGSYRFAVPADGPEGDLYNELNRIDEQ